MHIRAKNSSFFFFAEECIKMDFIAIEKLLSAEKTLVWISVEGFTNIFIRKLFNSISFIIWIFFYIKLFIINPKIVRTCQEQDTSKTFLNKLSNLIRSVLPLEILQFLLSFQSK